MTFFTERDDNVRFSSLSTRSNGKSRESNRRTRQLTNAAEDRFLRCSSRLDEWNAHCLVVHNDIFRKVFVKKNFEKIGNVFSIATSGSDNNCTFYTTITTDFTAHTSYTGRFFPPDSFCTRGDILNVESYETSTAEWPRSVQNPQPWRFVIEKKNDLKPRTSTGSTARKTSASA